MTLPLPLGLSRVLDLTTSPAGAFGTMLLGDFGAEVILVESASASGLRAMHALLAPRLLRNKFACSLDVESPEGRDVCLRLAAACDFVFVDEDAGLPYEAASAVRPGVIYVAVEPSDSLEVGLAAAGAAFTALFHRRKSGEGQQINITAARVTSSLDGTKVKSDRPPSGCYRCVDGSIAVVVRSDEDERALRGVLRAEPNVPADDLSEVLQRWAAGQKVEAAAAGLQKAGVAAEPLRSVAEVASDTHLRARGFFETVASAEGVRLIEGSAYRFGRTPIHTRVPAPVFGEHTDYVLREVAGLGADEIAVLRESGVVAVAPVEAQ
jgi:crotonobetainyl-CoA:carnitine CoA-transferase CaiB-like acyl-CoA transferase